MSESTSRLRTAIEHVRREPGFGRNVVMVAVVVAMGLAVGSFILGKQQYTPPWADETLVWATFDETVGVAEGTGQEVRISGVPVGEIREAEIDDRGDALLLLAIKRDVYDKPIYSDATMVLRPKSPLNEMYVEINPGTPAAEPVAPEGVLPVANTRSPIQIDQPLSHLDEQSLEGLESLLAAADQALARAPQDLPAGLDATTAVLNDLRPVVEELDKRRENIKTLVTALGQVSQAFGKNDERLASLTDGMHKTLRSMAGEGDSLRSALAQLPGLTDDLDRSSGSVRRLTEQLDPTLDKVREASDVTPEALSRVTGTIERLDKTLVKAEPVARKLPGVVADLRPFVGHLNPALADLTPIVRQLHPITGGVVPYLPDVKAFIYQTNSLTSLRDANGGILRGLVQFGPATLPIEGLDELSPTQR